MSKKIIGIMIVMMMLLVPTASAGIIEDINQKIDNFVKNAKTLTFTSYASSVPVQIGFDKPTNFWIITGTVGWQKDSMVLIKLPTDKKDDIGNGEYAQPQNSITLTIDPKGSYETATLSKADYYFVCNSLDLGGTSCKTTFYRVEGANWITTTVYDVSLNGQSQTVKVGMNYPADVNLGQGAFIKNLGIISNGANAPSGDFVLVLNPDTNQYEFYRFYDLQNMVKLWNEYKPYNVWTSYTWPDVWTFLKSKGWLPPKPVMTAKTYTFNPSGDGNLGTLQMNYDKVAYSSFISVYIPSSLANTIILKMGASIATILSKTDFKVTEANSASFTVTVRNDGGDDYVTVKATSPYYTINPVTEFMPAGSTKVFTLTAYALEVTGDKSGMPVSVTADGSDPYRGDTTTTVYGTTYDKSTGISDYKLTVIPKSPTGTVISNAKIYIDGNYVFSGQNYVMKPRGDYTITSEITDGFYPPTAKKITMGEAEQTVMLQFANAPQGDDLTWIFWGIVAIIITILFMKLGIAQAILKQPALIIVLVLVLFILYFLWQLFNVAMGIVDNVNTAYDNTVALLPWNW